MSSRALSVVLVGLAPLIVRAILLPILPVPQPRVHDEFSHLLVADTFAQGRMANPAHPLWVHFESMHTIMQPVYASIYPIAQGLVIAAAQRMTGVPWVGVWLSVGVMCGAVCWMLQGWVPRRWAILGGALVAVRYGVLSYWMNSYYGGAVAAVGGALVIGAAGRLLFRKSDNPGRQSAVLAVGLAILANSRPYEGLLLGLPVLLMLGFALLRNRVPRLRVLLPLALVLGGTAIGMSYYFSQISGKFLQLPYSFYRETATQAPHFLHQSPREAPDYHHRVTRSFYSVWEMGAYEAARANKSPYGIWDKAASYLRFFLGPFLGLSLLLALPWMWKDPRTRFLFGVSILCATGLALEVWHSPHYAAPLTGLAMLLAIQAWRRIWLWRYGRLITALMVAGTVLTPLPRPQFNGMLRAGVLAQLHAMPGMHLVVVRYKARHDPGDEWVYNNADIDASKVVWAREMDPGSNRSLLRYFASRKVWLVEPDLATPRLSAYDVEALPDPPFQFVRLGVVAIEVLRYPEEVRQRVAARVMKDRGNLGGLSCDEWNYYFTAVTGVEAPNTAGCFAQETRKVVSLDRWFEWLLKQR